MGNPTHGAFQSHGQSHATRPQSRDQLYSKILCWTCGIGDPLGEATCGEHVDCICIRCESICGLSDKEPYVACSEGCELNNPDVVLGCYCKLLFVKCGLDIDPIKTKCAKPLVVANQKNIV